MLQYGGRDIDRKLVRCKFDITKIQLAVDALVKHYESFFQWVLDESSYTEDKSETLKSITEAIKNATSEKFARELQAIYHKAFQALQEKLSEEILARKHYTESANQHEQLILIEKTKETTTYEDGLPLTINGLLDLLGLSLQSKDIDISFDNPEVRKLIFEPYSRADYPWDADGIDGIDLKLLTLRKHRVRQEFHADFQPYGDLFKKLVSCEQNPDEHALCITEMICSSFSTISKKLDSDSRTIYAHDPEEESRYLHGIPIVQHINVETTYSFFHMGSLMPRIHQLSSLTMNKDICEIKKHLACHMPFFFNSLMNSLRSLARSYGTDTEDIETQIIENHALEAQMLKHLATLINEPLAIPEEPTHVLDPASTGQAEVAQAETVPVHQPKKLLANAYCPYFALVTGLVVATAIAAEGYKRTYSP